MNADFSKNRSKKRFESAFSAFISVPFLKLSGGQKFFKKVFSAREASVKSVKSVPSVSKRCNAKVQTG